MKSISIRWIRQQIVFIFVHLAVDLTPVRLTQDIKRAPASGSDEVTGFLVQDDEITPQHRAGFA